MNGKNETKLNQQTGSQRVSVLEPCCGWNSIQPKSEVREEYKPQAMLQA